MEWKCPKATESKCAVMEVGRMLRNRFPGANMPSLYINSMGLQEEDGGGEEREHEGGNWQARRSCNRNGNIPLVYLLMLVHPIKIFRFCGQYHVASVKWMTFEDHSSVDERK